MFVHLGLAVNVGDVMLLFVVVVTDTVSTSQHTRHQWLLLLLHITHCQSRTAAMAAT